MNRSGRVSTFMVWVHQNWRVQWGSRRPWAMDMRDKPCPKYLPTWLAGGQLPVAMLRLPFEHTHP